MHLRVVAVLALAHREFALCCQFCKEMGYFYWTEYEASASPMVHVYVVWEDSRDAVQFAESWERYCAGVR